MEGWRLRVRATAADWFTVLAVGCLVLAAVGGWAAYTGHVDPGTHVEERTVATWDLTNTVRHQATVTEPNPVFAQDRVLQNRSRYLAAAAPTVRLQSETGYTASERGSVDIAVEAVMVRRAVSPEGETTGQARDRQVFWQTSQTLTDRRVTGLAPGESAAVDVEMRPLQAANGTRTLVERLGGSPGEVQTVIIFAYDVRGTVNGQQVSRSWTTEALLDTTESSYGVTLSNSVPDGGQSVEQVTVPNESGPVRQIGGPAIIVLGIVGLVALAWGRHTDQLGLSPAEHDRLQYLDDRQEFDEWITTIALPPAADDTPRATAASLADLANFAIDADEGIVEDPTRGRYAVVHDGTLYTYEPPGEVVGETVDGVTRTADRDSVVAQNVSVEPDESSVDAPDADDD